MAEAIVLISRAESRAVLTEIRTEVFADDQDRLVGRRSPKRTGLVDAMVIDIQGLPHDLTVQLRRPDGTNFDLTGATTIRVSLFATTPVQQTLTIVAGSPTGAPADGLARFLLGAINFSGFADGEVEVVKSGRTYGFDPLQFKFLRRRST